jgi:hypothetical protein
MTYTKYTVTIEGGWQTVVQGVTYSDRTDRHSAAKGSMDISTVPFIRSLPLCPEDRQKVLSESCTLTATLHTVTYLKEQMLLTQGVYIYIYIYIYALAD